MWNLCEFSFLYWPQMNQNFIELVVQKILTFFGLRRNLSKTFCWFQQELDTCTRTRILWKLEYKASTLDKFLAPCDNLTIHFPPRTVIILSHLHWTTCQATSLQSIAYIFLNTSSECAPKMSCNPILIWSVSIVAALTLTLSVNGPLWYVGATFNSTPETLTYFSSNRKQHSVVIGN